MSILSKAYPYYNESKFVFQDRSRNIYSPKVLLVTDLSPSGYYDRQPHSTKLSATASCIKCKNRKAHFPCGKCFPGGMNRFYGFPKGVHCRKLRGYDCVESI